ncbi:MAG TPA: NTP transferase domain-containing protein [Thermoanaerobaculaceae bacterium]|nr:NTP transferase domain-containing protein [Thermoanaerobaculaceae bacterium]
MATGVAGLILAGGAGTRFGGPKAFACLPDGRTFLAACVEVLRAGGAAPVVATLPSTEPIAVAGSVDAITLPQPGLPMFDSLTVGLRRLLDDAGWDRVVVLPVDHPLVRPATVRALAAARADAANPVHRGKRGHPIMLRRTLAERIVSGALPGPTLRDVLHAVVTADVSIEDPGTTANCNTPDALAAALAAVARA